MRRILGTPVGSIPHLEAHLRVGHFCAWEHSQILQRHGIDKRLKGRTHLPVALHVVILEEAVVDTTHIGFDIARTRLHRHQTRIEEFLAIDERIPWRERGILDSLPTEDAHPHFLVKVGAYLLLAVSLRLQITVAVAVFHGLLKEFLFLFLADIAEGVALASLEFPFESGLYLFAEVLTHSLFGITLHT